MGRRKRSEVLKKKQKNSVLQAFRSKKSVKALSFPYLCERPPSFFSEEDISSQPGLLLMQDHPDECQFQANQTSSHASTLGRREKAWTNFVQAKETQLLL